MADLNTYYSPDDEPNTGFDPLPNGKYLCVITNSEMKPTRNGAGEYLELELEVIEGPYKSRKVWDRLTLKHTNEMTVKIARGTFRQIRDATGVANPSNSIELHNLPIVVAVGLKKRTDTGELTNVVKGYERSGGAGVPAVTAPSPSSNGSVAPWKR